MTQSHFGHLPEGDVSAGSQDCHYFVRLSPSLRSSPAGNFPALLQRASFFHSHYREAKSKPTMLSLLSPWHPQHWVVSLPHSTVPPRCSYLRHLCVAWGGGSRSAGSLGLGVEAVTIWGSEYQSSCRRPGIPCRVGKNQCNL